MCFQMFSVKVMGTRPWTEVDAAIFLSAMFDCEETAEGRFLGRLMSISHKQWRDQQLGGSVRYHCLVQSRVM